MKNAFRRRAARAAAVFVFGIAAVPSIALAAAPAASSLPQTSLVLAQQSTRSSEESRSNRVSRSTVRRGAKTVKYAIYAGIAVIGGAIAVIRRKNS